MYLTEWYSVIKYISPRDVMIAFYDVRVDYYSKRKQHLLNTLTDAWEKLDNKVK